MNNELKKRILTSLFLSGFLILAFFYSFILIILLIIIFLLSWIEFNVLIKRIINKNENLSKILRLLVSAITLIYLFYFSVIVFGAMQQLQPDYKFNLLYLILICICSDVGGFIFGKIFKGKKLTKISPNKTISGSIGSFILPLILAPIFFYLFSAKFSIFQLVILAISVSLICQLGDLFISFLKRKANVKDTGDLLPGHGGILDRIDGILFAIPFGLILWKFLIVII
tara:strand:- start:1285 stop:1965 length:681 start_codon:yes stop_codon:yes gene_type:complete